MDRVLLIILSLLIFSSCTKQGTTPTKIQVSSVALVGNVAEQTAGGLYIYGFGSNGARFGKVLSENSFNETLPNGTWSFYVVGWAGGANQLAGLTRCGSSKNVKLNGSEVNLSLTISNTNCGEADFTNNAGMNPHPTIVGKHVFPKVLFESCKAFPATPGNGGDPSNLCSYNMSNLSIPRLKGYFSSLQVIVPSFMKSSSSASPSFSNDEELTSICLPISHTQAGGVGDASKIASLNLPVGTMATPFPFKVRGFYGNNECAIDAKGFKEFTLLNGRQENSAAVKAIQPVMLAPPATQPTGWRIYLTASDSDVCASSFNLNFLQSLEQLNYPENPSINPFSGGNGSAGLPYLICNNTQLNLISDDLVSSYRLVSDLDFQFGINDNEFAPIGASLLSPNSNSTKFSGVFDGNKHKLENIFLIVDTKDFDSAYSDFGLFRQVDGAKILDLRVDNTSVVCRSDTYEKKCSNTGILVGEALNTTFKNLYIKGHLVGADYSGGIAGKISFSSNTSISKIENSFVEVIIDSKCPTSTCYNYGGFVGESTLTDISNSSAKISIHSEGLSGVGGLVGNAINTKITNSSSFGEISGTNYTGGLAGTFVFNNYGFGFQFTSEVTNSFSHAYVFARQEGGTPVAGALVAICVDSLLPITRSYHAVGKAFSNNDPKGLYGSNTGVEYVYSAQASPSYSSAPCTSANEECLANSSDFKDISWLNTNLGGNFVNTTSAAFEILEVDDKNEYPRHKWESQIESILGYKIPFLERKCSGKLGYDSPDAEGQGTETNPYIICSVDQLQGELWGDSSKYFKLMRDLDFEGTGPELGDSGELGANFNGNNFSFKNIVIQVDSPRGLWQTISSDGVLKNLKIRHSHLMASPSVVAADALEENNFGFLAKVNYGVIDNVLFESSRIDIRGWIFSSHNIDNENVITKVNLGSLVGINDGTISGSRVGGRLDFFDEVNNDLKHYDNLSVGSISGINKGLITQSSGRFEFEVKSFSATSDFIMDESVDTVNLGGIVGLNDEDGSITESEAEFRLDITNSANISNKGVYSYGGIAGKNAGLIENSLSSVAKFIFISGSQSLFHSYAGGIVGRNTETGKVKKSISYLSMVDTNNSSAVGGVVGNNLITAVNSYFVSNNMCAQESDLNISYSSLTYPSDQCLTLPLSLTTSGSSIIFEDSTYPTSRLKTLSDFSFSFNENPNEASSVWILRPESGEIELRATKSWFDDI